MNERSCIFCETESNHVVIQENGYSGKKCPQCGLIYISPRPTFIEIMDLYGHDDAHISAACHISSDFLKRLYAKHHLRIIRSFVKSGELLEIGAGAGYFLDEARKIGFNPHGLELNPIQAKYIRDTLNIPCEESLLNKTVFKEKKFDVVFHCDVISHFFDPISDFRTIHAKMNDNGLLIFETGNLGEVDLAYFKYIQRFQYPDHLFFFSTDNLIELLRLSGFRFIKIYRYSILPQLRISKNYYRIKNSIKMFVNKPNKEVKHLSEGQGIDIQFINNNMRPFSAKSIIKKSLRNLYHYFNYVLRYEIGRIAPKAYRPQSIIVVAKKA